MIRKHSYFGMHLKLSQLIKSPQSSSVWTLFKSWCLKIWPICFNLLTWRQMHQWGKCKKNASMILHECNNNGNNVWPKTRCNHHWSCSSIFNFETRTYSGDEKGVRVSAVRKRLWCDQGRLESSWHHKCFKGSKRYWLYINELVHIVVFFYKERSFCIFCIFNFYIRIILMLFATQLSWLTLIIFFFINCHMHSR